MLTVGVLGNNAIFCPPSFFLNPLLTLMVAVYSHDLGVICSVSCCKLLSMLMLNQLYSNNDLGTLQICLSWYCLHGVRGLPCAADTMLLTTQLCLVDGDVCALKPMQRSTGADSIRLPAGGV